MPYVSEQVACAFLNKMNFFSAKNEYNKYWFENENGEKRYLE